MHKLFICAMVPGSMAADLIAKESHFYRKSDYDALAASVDRLTSDKARLAAELGEWRGLYESGLEDRNGLLARIKALEAAIESIHTMRLNWALVCACKCSECDIFFEGIRDVLPETQSETKGEL